MTSTLPTFLAVLAMTVGITPGATAAPARNIEFASSANYHLELSQPLGGVTSLTAAAFFARSQFDWARPMKAQADELEILSLNTPSPEDHYQDEYGFFDGIFKVPASLPVPEPSVLSIVAMGAAFVLGRRRNRN